MAIVGAHVLLYTRVADRLRETLRDVLGWDSVEGHDPPDGWLIFKLPPADLGVHPGETPHHEVTLMCDDLSSTVAELGEKGIEFRGEPRDALVRRQTIKRVGNHSTCPSRSPIS